MKKLVFTLTTLLIFMAGSAFATTYTIQDNWTDWPGYPSSYPNRDELTHPDIDTMTVVVEDGMLQGVTMNYRSDSRIVFDSLFINTSGDWSENNQTWDYYVMSRNPSSSQSWYSDGPLANSGLYSVADDYNYNKVIVNGRIGTPSGISDDGALTAMDQAFTPIYNANTYQLVYDFSGMNIDVSDGLFLAYSPWCGNDVIGGSPSSVPEPATLILLGSGFLGLGLCRRFRK